VRRILAGVVVLLLVAAAGCGDDDGAAPATTTSTTADTTTTTTEADDDAAEDEDDDAWAVPDPIDEAYVEAVLTELYRLQGDALRQAMDSGEVTEDVIGTFAAVYDEGLAATQISGLVELAADGFPGLHDPPGDVGVSVVEVVSAGPECIAAMAHLDFSPVALEPGVVPFDAVVLGRSPASPVGWRIDRMAGFESAEDAEGVAAACDRRD
jgi:hypothetical protein